LPTRATFAILLAITLFPSVVHPTDDWADLLSILDRYLRASYARDFRSAYQYISARDQRLKDESSYVRERGAFTGFTLEVTKRLAAHIEISSVVKRIADNRAAVKVRLKVPDAQKLAVMLLHWDTDRLNALSAGERSGIIDSLAQLRQDGNLDMAEGEESLEMIKEGTAWRVFLNWAAGLKFNFHTAVPSTAPIQAKLSQSEGTTYPGEPFKISLKITNTSEQAVTARIGHLIDPHEFRDYLDLIECGFLLPFRLLPGEQEEFTSTYLLRRGLPENVRQLTMTYAVVVQD
jgi:cytochrome c oxidase assembly protein CtaG/Cox11